MCLLVVEGWEVEQRSPIASGSETSLARAKALILEAIDVLDEANAPAQLAAQLDHVVHRIEAFQASD